MIGLDAQKLLHHWRMLLGFFLGASGDRHR
jgi:hypothetical protein